MAAYRAVVDSVFSEKNAEVLAQMEKKYQSAQKDKSLLEQQGIIQDKELKLQKRNLALVTAFALVLFVSALLYFQYRQNQSKERENALQLKLAEQKNLTRIQKERMRISRELHDNIGSYLTLISALVDQLSKSPQTADDSQINQLNETVTKSMRELRKTAWLLNRQTITIEELGMRLREFFKPVHQSGIRIKVDVAGNPELCLNEIQTTQVFRIIQEAINNAYKHAGSSEISVTLDAKPSGHFTFEISDSGAGFSPEKQNSGNGLKNMKERTELLGGKFDVTTAPGKGTTIQGSFVLNNAHILV